MGKSGVGRFLDVGSHVKNLSQARSIYDVADPGGFFHNNQQEQGSYTPWNGIGGIEAAAGATPPKYQSLRDVNGDLLSKYKINPFSGEASQKLRAEALSSGPSEWAKNATEAERMEEGLATSRAGLQEQGAQSGALSSIARMGGLGGGTRANLARSGARDLLNAKQNIAGQGIQARYGINDQDMQRRQALLGTTSDLERGADTANLASLTGDIQGQSAFDMDRYKSILQAYGANQTANATAAAGAKSGGGKK